MGYPKSEGVDGRSVPSKDLGGFSVSGEPKSLNDKGRAAPTDMSGESGQGPAEAIGLYGGVSGGRKISSIRADQPIDIPKEGQNDAANLKV